MITQGWTTVRIRIPSALIVVVCYCFLLASASAQDSRGTITGRVTDAQRGVIPGVSVMATQTSTGLANTTITNDAGVYVLPRLLIGPYRVQMEIKGFKTYVRENVEVRIQATVVLDAVMEIGQVTETVTVTGQGPILDMGSASTGSIMDDRKLQDLPLGHGAAVFSVYLLPGVTMGATANANQRMQRAGFNMMRVNGSPKGSNEFLIDGAPNAQVANEDASGGGSISFSPQSEVIEQLKVQTGDFDASVGHTGGAVVSMALKSGTNEFHGTAYRYWRPTDLTANNFFSNKTGTARPDVVYSRWGFAVGGPILKNRTFFHFGFDQWHERFSAMQTGTVPTSKQLQGDFSDLLALGSQYQIYDPTTIAAAPNGRFSIKPFQGNIIPASRIDPIAKKLAALWPGPNLPGTADGRNNLYYEYYPSASRSDPASTLKIDHQLTASHRLAGSAILSKTSMPMRSLFGRDDIAPQAYSFSPRHYSLEDVWTINSHLIASLRISNMRFVALYTMLGKGTELSSYGFDNKVIDLLPAPDGLPSITVTNYTGIPSSADSWNITDIWSTAGHLTYISGNHALKFGTDLRLYRLNQGAVPNLNLTFNTRYTQGPFDNSTAAPIGQDLAAFLVGIPSSGNITLSAQLAEQNTSSAFYVHDDWKITRNLTLSFGLRYEREGPFTERYDRSVRSFDFETASPIESQAQANYAKNPIPEIPVSQFRARGGLLFAGVGNQPRALFSPDNNNFMPRFGFAYRLTPRTVLRGGYGIFMINRGLKFQGIAAIPTGFSQATIVVPTLDSGQTFVASLDNPFPNGLQQAVGAQKGLMTEVGNAVSFFPEELPNPYNQRWALTVQREWAGFKFEIGYVGNRTTKMIIKRDLDALPNQYLSKSTERDQSTINYLSAAVSNPFYGLLPGTSLAGQNVSRSQLLRPYAHFTGLSVWNNQGYSYYHAMQAQLERRFQQGFTLLTSFTWQKLMDAMTYLNPGDPLPEKVISNMDATRMFTTSAVWELPFGPGKLLGGSHSGILGRITGGWQLQGNAEIQTGFPLDWGNVLFRGNIKDIKLSNPTIDRWFNIDAGFERASAKQLSSNLRAFPSRLSNVRGDTNKFLNLSLTKNTLIKESVRLVFTAEAYNFTNTPTFYTPDMNPVSTAFGQVTRTLNWYPRQIALGLRVVF
jgi:hypothetical protein